MCNIVLCLTLISELLLVIMKDNKDSSFMIKLSTLIVDKRNLIFLMTIIAILFSVVSKNWIQVENNLSEYLPTESESKIGLDLMDREFVTYGTARVMVSNIDMDKGDEILEELKNTEGVQRIEYSYDNISALYDITFNYSQNDDSCLDALNKVKEKLNGYDIFVSTDLGNSTAEILDKEVGLITLIVAIIVVTVLIFTSKTYAEVIVLIMTFVIAMILNNGTTFLLGTISFVSNSVTSILQLALSLDYAIILCNRFKEEHESLPLREAVIIALSKGIPEIGASSLTTIGGLVAMMFMQFKIGFDMAICLIKAIIFALLSVFIVMPGLLMLFGSLMDKTKHKDFVPKIPFVGHFDYKTRHIVPVIFVVLLIVSFFLSNNCPYAYGYGAIDTPKINDVQRAKNLIEESFGSNNFVALVYEGSNYDIERRMIDEIESYDEVDYCMGLSNIEAIGGYMLEDKLSPREFAELSDLDYEVCELLYSYYALVNKDYGQIINNISDYKVPLIDMLLFACDKVESGVVSLNDEQMDMLMEAKTAMLSAKNQLQGENYNRILVYLTLPVSGNETYQFIDTLRGIGEEYFDGDVYIVGESTSEYDFLKSFERDNIVVTIVSILIVLTVLLFTFNSVAMPILLIAVIEGAIWINFSIPTIKSEPIFFLSYLIVSSIQMGANIDYAIVIGNRYQELKNKMPHEEAIVETLNFAFPTILTSGTVLATAGMLLGFITSDAAIVGIGTIGQGTIISMILVMFVLPQVLELGSSIVEKTSFKIQKKTSLIKNDGLVVVDGLVNGEVNGKLTGVFKGTIDGVVNLNLLSGEAAKETSDEKNS